MKGDGGSIITLVLAALWHTGRLEKLNSFVRLSRRSTMDAREWGNDYDLGGQLKCL